MVRGYLGSLGASVLLAVCFHPEESELVRASCPKENSAQRGSVLLLWMHGRADGGTLCILPPALGLLLSVTVWLLMLQNHIKHPVLNP